MAVSPSEPAAPGDRASGPVEAPSAPDSAAPGAEERGAPISDADWETIRPQLRGIVRAVFSPATLVSVDGDVVTLGLPNDAHRAKCEQHREAVEEALGARAGSAVSVVLVVDDGGGGGGRSTGSGPGSGSGAGVDAPTPDVRSAGPTPTSTTTTGALAEDSQPRAASAPRPRSAEPQPHHLHIVAGSVERPSDAVRNGRAIAEQARTQGPPPDPEDGLQRLGDTLPDDDDVDLEDLVDAPPESVKSPVDRLAEAFPGSELVDDPY